METPSSAKRMTRSQVKSTMINNIPISRKNEGSDSKQRTAKVDRSALIDITNDSPIVGLAMGSLETPSSHLKKREQLKQTPGSGEALLRGQVKTLLQKVEEADEVSKISFVGHRRFPHLQVMVNSPYGGTTPANTPQVPNLSSNGDDSFDLEAIMEVDGVNQEETLEFGMSQLSRSLLLDFSEKSEVSDSSSCSSVVTYQREGRFFREKSCEDDDASVWSMQVNASTQDEEEGEEIVDDEEDYENGDYKEEEEDGQNDGLFDELCEGLSKISVEEKNIPEFEGKHTRFVYNSDGDIEGEEEVRSTVSPSVLHLKGIPLPEGKHLRFAEGDEN
ncbi:hypothetical protein GIB67_020033 [Kingdonia uniflora]|uniref:Chalcone-flavanone isomerase family protein n=1 Tax=Kingdonia uniflora TaxID=39325 RepID=A0A7J7N4C4_9MAGN|nr:hypothetical protein GIB67_020033 [Kingdonia uniflora]